MPARKHPKIKVRKLTPRDRAMFKDMRAIPQVQSTIQSTTREQVAVSLGEAAQKNRQVLDEAGVKIPAKMSCRLH